MTSTRGPVIVGYDGSPASECALVEAAGLLPQFPALVVVVWEAGVGFELVDDPSPTPAPIDVRTALEIDEKLAEGAQRLAERGASLARKCGLDAEALAVADDVTPAATLVRLARERHARAVVVGHRGRRGLADRLGSTTREVIRDAPCPVVVRADQ
jgi:nucleotide-binding universal stress UspA family protein